MGDQASLLGLCGSASPPAGESLTQKAFRLAHEQRVVAVYWTGKKTATCMRIGQIVGVLERSVLLYTGPGTEQAIPIAALLKIEVIDNAACRAVGT